eukprot:8540206-Pyramimonas_sp.AAC.1
MIGCSARPRPSHSHRHPSPQPSRPSVADVITHRIDALGVLAIGCECAMRALLLEFSVELLMGLRNV